MNALPETPGDQTFSAPLDVIYFCSADTITIHDKDGVRTIPVPPQQPSPPVDYSKIKRPF